MGLPGLMKCFSPVFSLTLLMVFAAIDSSAQTVDSMIVLWKSGRIAELRSAVKYHAQSKEPEVEFFRAVLDQDGSRSVLVYNRLFKEHPGSPIADDALFLSAQYDYALGFYVRAGEKLDALIEKYPNSEYVAQAKSRFSESFTPVVAGKEEKVSDQTGVKSEEKPVKADVELRYTVQVGAFSDKANAEGLRDKLLAGGYEVELGSKVKDGTTLYLVWVGSFSTPGEALETGQALKSKWGLNYGVVEK